MSHIVEIKTEVRCQAAVHAACSRLGLPQPVRGTVRLYADTATGLTVRLPGWRYPVVCNLDTGRISFDNFNGLWGEQRHLHTFLQAYAVEKAMIEARKNGHDVTETRLHDGSIRVTVRVGGAA
jgi:hypothetical protein